MSRYDLTAPWNQGVKGTEVLPLINDNASIIRVEAGPGTGKTFGLCRRVVRLLHPYGLNASGSNVAVVAFNRVIAKDLQKKIETSLKEASISAAPIVQTVHGFCLRLLGEDLRMLLDHEREAMLYDVLHEVPDLRETFRSFEKTKQTLHDHEAHLVDHTKLWQAVRRWLLRHKAHLISDLPGLLVARIQGGDFGEYRYEHLLVDEFQDLTQAEQELFLALRPSLGQLVALGDRRQSIYAFLGNDRLGLAKLDEHAAASGIEVHDIPLTECQRCPADIVTAANRLMNLSPAKPMKCVSEAKAKILVVCWKTPESEARGMAQLLKDNIDAFPEADHLMMVTRRQFGYWLRDELFELDKSISVELSFSESILENWPVRESFLFFCLLADPDAPTWRAWLGYQAPDRENSHNAPQRNAGAYLKFLSECNDVISSETVLRLNGEDRKKLRGSGGSSLWDRARRYSDVLAKQAWDDLEANELIDKVFHGENWLSQKPADQEATTNDFNQLRKTASEMLEEFSSTGKALDRSQVLRQVARQLRYNIATRKPFVASESSKLKVTTLWGAKGLTADHVYVLGLCKEAIPGIRRESYPGTESEYNEEQLRLFYVSITRAKTTLVLSRANRIRKGQARTLNLYANKNWFWISLEMCPFLRDIMIALPEAKIGEELLRRNPPFRLSQL